MLRDNGVALVIGERTFGAGCDYTNGGLPARLPHSGLIVHMPDCARLRLDGTNGIEGIAPDLPLEWSELDGTGRSAALRAALGRQNAAAATTPRRRPVSRAPRTPPPGDPGTAQPGRRPAPPSGRSGPGLPWP